MKHSFEPFEQAMARAKRFTPDQELGMLISCLSLAESQIADLRKHSVILSRKIGSLVKTLRGTKHRQNTLARKAGISQSTLAKLEKGYPDAPAIPSSTARKLYKLLKP